MKKYLFLLVIFGFSTSVFSQTVPPNTRLFQVNTVKGSELKIVESTPQHVYHVGTANSEIGFDGLNFSQVGLDDLYILKSKASNGQNVWFKTFDAGATGSISPRSVHIDASDNIFVYGTFSGTITAGSTTATSSETVNGFLLKLNSSGTSVWVKPLVLSPTAVAASGALPKIANDDTDVFITYNFTNLLRINNTDGTTVFDNIYANTELGTVILKNSDLYVSGFSANASTSFNSEIVEGPNQGFVIKGNKDAVFSASLQTKNPGNYSNITDIAFSSDGQLLISGFNKNRMDLKTGTGILSYTFVPDQNFENDNVYNFIVKISPDLQTPSHFRTSGVLFSTSSNNTVLNKDLKSKIIPVGNSGKYKVILTRLRGSIGSSQTNANGSSASNHPFSFTSTSQLLSSEADGEYTGEIQPYHNDFVLSAAEDFYSATTLSYRTFNTTIYTVSTQNELWTKEKLTSVGGSLSLSFAKHLKSEPSESFFTTLVEGKGDFFGQLVNNADNQFTRFIARLGVDGLPKWTAKFSNDSGKSEETYAHYYILVDKDDNFYFLGNTNGTNPSFTDATGTVFNFPQNYYTSSKILIKIDKDGKYLWSKSMTDTFGKNESTAVLTTDNFGDVYILGNNYGSGFYVDGFNFNGSVFLMKLNALTGSLVYGKSYNNLDLSSLNAVFDAQNSLYLFTEPYNYLETDFTLDGITIPANLASRLDLLMLKFDSSGNVIWGKNFYQNAPAEVSSYVFPNDVKFDGIDFILMGTIVSTNSQIYQGLDLVPLPREYPLKSNTLPFLAKVATDGSVQWQDVLNNNGGSASYTNIELDSNKNIYMYYFVRDKQKYRGVEYQYDAVKGDKIAQKFNNDGDLQYTVKVDKMISKVFANPVIDVIKEDTFNLLAITAEESVLNYPINNSFGSNLYLTTFGTLGKNYLTPKKDFLELHATEIPNNPAPTPNEFSFDLINNVNWTATSDQSWLSLSSISLTSKSPQQTSTGHGDAKITLTADENTTGAMRSSNVEISGEGVPSKTLIVSQTATLGVNSSILSLITLYPNPTSDILNIETQQKISKIEIFDLSGKMVKSVEGKAKNISVSNLTNGMYLIKLYTESGVMNSKFIKK